MHRVELERPGLSIEQGALTWLDDRLADLPDDARLELTAGALRLALSRERTITAAAIAKRKKVDALELVDVALEAEPSRLQRAARRDTSIASVVVVDVPAGALVRRAYDGTTPAELVCGSGIAAQIEGRIVCGRCGHKLEAHSALSPRWGESRTPGDVPP